MKKITIRWDDQRNIKRIIKWLGLNCDFSGGFTGVKYSGYKTSGRNDDLIFNINRKC